MALLGIDFGTKRIGLALAADEERPARFKVVANDERLWDCLLDIMEDHDVELAVIGLPRNLEGDDTPQTLLARQFADELQEISGCEVLLQDEADTSNQARQRLAQSRLNEREQEQMVDAEAAAIILEDYLSDRGQETA